MSNHKISPAYLNVKAKYVELAAKCNSSNKMSDLIELHTFAGENGVFIYKPLTSEMVLEHILNQEKEIASLEELLADKKRELTNVINDFYRDKED